MSAPSLLCVDERRRHKLRAADLNGLDFIEVSEDQRTLQVCFLGKAPKGLQKENIQIRGGRRVRGGDIDIAGIKIHRNEEPDLDDCMEVFVGPPGDFSTYTLCVVERDHDGEPTDRPFRDFDPRYACLEFSFKAGCSTDLDCKPREICPPPERDEPEISYLAKDYASFRQLILDRLALIMPEWEERHVPDLGIALVEPLAYVGDYLSYYQDAVATEAYLGTARQRVSVRRHARLVDYAMHEGCNARAWVCVRTSAHHLLDPADTYFVTRLGDLSVPEGEDLSKDQLAVVQPGDYEAFSPLVQDALEPIQLVEAHNTIPFYTWSDRECCLPRGATSATLTDEWRDSGPDTKQDEYANRDAQQSVVKKAPAPAPGVEPRRALELKTGDVLIFEEVLGPKTGNKADADPAHRQAVRLTRVEPKLDSLCDQPVLEIQWGPEDALRFPLCLSALGRPPECALLEDISVARGNVILVDHGRWEEGEDLGQVPEEPVTPECKREGMPSQTAVVPGRFRPGLKEGPLTFGEPLPVMPPASRMLTQDPRRALPHIRLISDPPPEGCDEPHWSPRRDLLDSRSRDCHFVVEIDNERTVHLRFGDGELGWMPEAEAKFKASYRVGIGPRGNVGAETISHVVLRRGTLGSVKLRPRNPMPAQGGTAPEPLADVELLAPHTFRAELQRAVTAADYARLAERHPEVQRAAATLRWTGSWYEMLVTIDPLGRVEADSRLLGEIEDRLYIYRRIGHDLAVAPALYVPLHLGLIVCLSPGYLRGYVEAELLEVLSNRDLMDGRRGFFHPDNLTFGGRVLLSQIVAVAQKVQGVESVVVSRLERLHEGANGELANGFLPLGPTEIARLDNDPSFPEDGQLELDVRGGR